MFEPPQNKVKTQKLRDLMSNLTQIKILLLSFKIEQKIR